MKPFHLVRIPLALAVVSCAAPKATVVGEPAAPAKPKPAAEETAAPPMPPAEDDGIRLPDMLTLPDDGEFRAGAAGQPAATGGGAGAVIARPPTDPPSRPKPEAGE